MIKEFHGASLDHLFEYHVYSEASTSQVMSRKTAMPMSPHAYFDDLIIDLDGE